MTSVMIVEGYLRRGGRGNQQVFCINAEPELMLHIHKEMLGRQLRLRLASFSYFLFKYLFFFAKLSYANLMLWTVFSTAS